MPRLRPLAPPDRVELASRPLHLLVRDWPETLAVLREHGVDVAAQGGRPPSELRPENDTLIQALEQATAWRASRS